MLRTLKTGLSFGFGEGDQKEERQQEIGTAKAEVGGMHAVLKIQHKDGDAEAEFFQYGGNHDGPQADGIGGDHEKGNLPGKGDASKPVVKAGMSDGRRILLSDALSYEIQRSDDDDP